jgi:DNA-directed RNA polymerase subunit RPC12/RpoP
MTGVRLDGECRECGGDLLAESADVFDGDGLRCEECGHECYARVYEDGDMRVVEFDEDDK